MFPQGTRKLSINIFPSPSKLNENRKENYRHDHIPFNLLGDGIIFCLSVSYEQIQKNTKNKYEKIHKTVIICLSIHIILITSIAHRIKNPLQRTSEHIAL